MQIPCYESRIFAISKWKADFDNNRNLDGKEWICEMNKQFRACFLARSSGKEALKIELRCLNDDNSAGKIVIVKGDLIEERLDKRLARGERKFCKIYSLIVAALRARSEFVHSLRSHRFAVSKQPARKVGTFQQPENGKFAVSVMRQQFSALVNLGLAFGGI